MNYEYLFYYKSITLIDCAWGVVARVATRPPYTMQRVVVAEASIPTQDNSL